MIKHSESSVESNEIGLVDMARKAGVAIRYLLGRWGTIAIITLLGCAIGFSVAVLKPTFYSAKMSFVLEESKSPAGGLASLAGQFGLDLSGGGGGIFAGDNVLLFLKSRNLIRETLLQPVAWEGSTVCLADEYAKAADLQKNWQSDKRIGVIKFFGKTDATLSRVEDSLLQQITDNIVQKDLTVSRPDKKATFVEVRVKTRGERLSKYFCERLVELALNRYVTSKIKLKEANVRKLQRRADSLEMMLNARTYNAAASQQSLLDINPGLRTASAAPEIRSREKMTVATIYGEVVKNLELAKTILNQETPTIEVVDRSTFPLERERVSKSRAATTGGVIALLFICGLLLVRLWWQKVSSFL